DQYVMKDQLSETLRSRTFIGLLLAQFTATFNDQAIHMVAVFYAVDMLVRYAHVPHIDEKAVVSLVTACFITPFLLFSSFAGTLGDRFSKRSVIVFWKVAEVGMMGLALGGLLLPHLVPADSASLPTLATWSAALVISTVFLMGLHSTFFVPAKLGAMPEILHPSELSRGNGILEGTSFTAQILGTSAGGILYALLKGNVSAGRLEPGREWMIGALLFVLALVGTITALLMRRIPAAAPDTKLSWNWWRPLQQNMSILWRSKPLTLSVTGIAFCVFMTLFLRQTLLYQGELKKELETARTMMAHARGNAGQHTPTGVDKLLADVLPERLEKAAQEPELRVALLFALVGLGVGLGSIVAGFVSGHRVELGLVPLGAVAIAFFTLLPGLMRRAPLTFVACLFGIGFGAGFYLVPLYTLLQHRAPKQSKGNVVAASNFLNVVGGVFSVALFYLLSFMLGKFLGPSLTEAQVLRDSSLVQQYVDELDRQMNIPRVLFLVTSLLTIGALWVLVQRLPDFFLRTAIWIRAWGHNTLRTVAVENMPLDGPVILVNNCDSFRSALDLIAAVDRFPHVILAEDQSRSGSASRLRRLAERTGMVSLGPAAGRPDWDRALEVGMETLRRGEMVALSIELPADLHEVLRLVTQWRKTVPTAVIPVYCSSAGPPSDAAERPGRVSPRVVFGTPLAATEDLDTARAAIAHLATVAEDHVGLPRV
ncbi:MAG TPA: MFS transporter, partial [Planctomycetaceae bacterium]|nr:MFS transporter [Planctomycetaceae bacterium]